MTKVAIITTHHFPNYGNKLQNYALQTVLQNMGCEVETINDARSYPDMTSYLANWKALLHIVTGFRKRPSHTKILKFIKWSREHIVYSPKKIKHAGDEKGFENKYDYFIVGADQIWNPEFPIFSNSLGFATFARKEQKIAYAPSLGISEMIKEREDEYRDYLKDWKALSCREYEGAKIIERLSGEKVAVLPDPTMLLTSDEWSNLASKPLNSKPYAILYCIRNIDEKIRLLIEENVQKKGWRLFFMDAYHVNDGYNPEEFLSLLKNAQAVYTDSFHGCVFSLLFHRPLAVLHIADNQMDKISRIRTLFENCGIPNANYSKIINEYFELNWDSIDRNIASKREEGIEYLKKNIQ